MPPQMGNLHNLKILELQTNQVSADTNGRARLAAGR